MSFYQYCSVPTCLNSAKNNPGKIFITMPKLEKRRKLWLEAIGVTSEFSKKTHLSVCEDHFNLEKDMENYCEFKMMGTKKKRMRPHVVPYLNVPAGKKNKPSSDEPSTSHYCNLPSLRPKYDIGIQVRRHLINSSLQVRPYFRSKQTQCALTNIKDLQCLPLKTVTIDAVRLNDNMFLELPTTKELTKQACSEENLQVQEAIFRIEANPRIYLGIPKESYSTLEVLQKHVQSDLVDILVALKKIKTNCLDAQLAQDFNLTESDISTKFLNVLPKISRYMLCLTVWPNYKNIQENMPLLFRLNNTIQYIITCLEVDIEPSTFKSLTWSDSKKRHTIKYLISFTPNGAVNFVSKGFGGATSNSVLLENSNFLDKLKPGSTVLADWSFNRIEPLLTKRKCTLLRSPSVPSGTKLSKSDVLLVKRIGSLISGIREFYILNPTVDQSLLSNIDDIVVTICGIINLQNSVIK